MPGPFEFNPCETCCQPACCNCTFSGANGNKPGSLVVDLGAGGWIDNLCVYCDQVAGQFTVSGGGGDVPCFNCVWQYFGDGFVCVFPSPIPSAFLLFEITFRHMQQIPATLPWWWEVEVDMRDAFHINNAVYKSATTSDPNCWDLGGEDSSNKIALTKQSEAVDADSCSGNLPNTIHVWKP